MNLLLQHWHGPMGELEKASMEAMQRYAAALGVEYELVRGEPLGPRLTAQMHKLYALDKRFDCYDTVVMTDMDMFPRIGSTLDIFVESGIGVMTRTQLALRASLHARYPRWGDPEADYYGGALYRLTAEVRATLRPFLKQSIKAEFGPRFQDEGAMHLMASAAGFQGCQLPGGERWAMSSYDPHVAEAHLIHVRTKIAPLGPKREKLDNYRDLVDRGFIAP